MIIFVFLIFVVAIIILVVNTILVIYHFYHFRIGRSHQALISFFIFSSAILFILEFLIFSSVDLKAISGLMENYLKLSR